MDLNIDIVKQFNCLPASNIEYDCEEERESLVCSTNAEGICDGEIETDNFDYILIEVKMKMPMNFSENNILTTQTGCLDCEPSYHTAEYRDLCFDIKVLTNT